MGHPFRAFAALRDPSSRCNMFVNAYRNPADRALFTRLLRKAGLPP